MTSITLGETEKIAMKYADNNLSGFLRKLIIEYDEKKNNETIQTNNKKKIIKYYSITYMSIAISLLLFGISYVFPIINVILPAFFITCGIMLIIYIYIRIDQNKKGEIHGY